MDAEAHFPLLRDVLLNDLEEAEGVFPPAAEEAGLALARLGTPEAMTALIQAYVTPGMLWSSLHTYLETIVRRFDGHDEPISEDGMRWHRRRFSRRERLRP